MPDLTIKQLKFVSEYRECGNATEAAKRAGYSSHSATRYAVELLNKPHVRAALGRATADMRAFSTIELGSVLQELGRIGLSDPRHLFDGDGRLLPPHQWSDAAAASIASFEVVTKHLGEGEVEYVAKIRTWDKVAALDKLMRHLGQYNDKLTVEHDVSRLEDALHQGRARVASMRAQVIEHQAEAAE